MKPILSQIFVILLLVSATAGQAAANDKTVLEKFRDKRKGIILKAESKITTINTTITTADSWYSSLAISVVEYSEPVSGERVFGVRFDMDKPDNQFAVRITSYIDENEIKGLINGVDYLLRLQRNQVTKLDAVIANYRTKDGTEIWAAKGASSGYGFSALRSRTLNDLDGSRAFFYFGNFADVQHFQQALVNASGKLQSVK